MTPAKQKRICFVTTVHGTLRAFVMEFAEYLHQNGYDVSVACNFDESFSQEIPSYIHYYPIPMTRGVSFDGVRAVRALKQLFLRENFDIIQYATPNAALYASMAARMAKCPIRIYTQWGIRYMGFSGVRRMLFRYLEKMTCRNSTYIEPESFGIRDFAITEGLYPEEKCEVIWNGSACGVNLSRFSIENSSLWRQEIRKRYGLSEDSTVFGFAGRLTRDKGCNELLTAFQKLAVPDAKLLIMGAMDNEPSLQPELLQWAKNDPNVIFTGRVQDVNKHYSALDVFVAPSYREGFGLVLVEAQAMGIPVIATDVPGQIDAFLPNKTGLAVKAKDTSSLLDAMQRLYTDTALRKNLAENAHSFAADNFEQQRLFEKIKEKRDSLIEG